MCRMKSTLTRLGIRGFEPDLKKAADRLDDLRLPSGEVLSPDALAEVGRDMALLRASDDGEAAGLSPGFDDLALCTGSGQGRQSGDRIPNTLVRHCCSAQDTMRKSRHHGVRCCEIDEG